MQVAVDISLYPLHDDFIPPIKDVIERLEARGGIEVERNRMSTQVRGEYDVVMSVLKDEMRATFDAVPHAVFAMKVIGNPVN